MDDEGGVVHYDAASGSLRLRLDGGEAITIEGLRDLSFRAGGGRQPLSTPLWLSHKQADILGKMIGHYLANVKISPAGQAVLEELRPLVDDIKAELETLADEDGVPSIDSAAE